MAAGPSSSSSQASARSSRATRETLHELLRRGRLPARARKRRPGQPAGPVPRRDWWYTTDEEVELTPEIATQVMIEMLATRARSHFREMRHRRCRPSTLRPAHGDAHARRASQLRARGELAPDRPRVDVRRPPVTELGRQEAEFYARAGVAGGSGERGLRPTALDLHEAGRPRPAARQPGGDPDALPALAPAELDDAPRAASAISASVTSWRRIEAACTPHISPQRRTVSCRARARRSARSGGARRPAAPSGPTASARPARRGRSSRAATQAL